ncbi:MAG: hypothetical protein V8T86_00400 [Victivallis sp.]
MIIPDGSWVKCRSCGQTLYTDRLEDNLQVCWYCNCHLPMNAPARIRSLTDADSFTEMDAICAASTRCSSSTASPTATGWSKARRKPA